MEMEGEIQGIKIGRTGQAITHLFFADDILIFCKAEVQQTNKIINCLEKFCSWTGQSFSPTKSGCFFSKNIRGSLKASIKESLNMRELDWDSKYLGNNLFPRARRMEEFEHIKRKICNRLEG